MDDNTVIVYSPDGAPERHTRPNARDLVNGAGYTWNKHTPSTPASYAPFARVTAPEGPNPSQKVLDSVGGSAGANGAAAGAAAAQAAESARIADALRAQQAAAEPEPEDVADFTAPVSLDDDAGLGDLDADPEEAGEPTAEADAETETETAPRRGGRGRRSAS